MQCLTSLRYLFHLICVVIAVVVVLKSHQVQADLFQYTDKDGTVVMVDDEGKIPSQYRKKVKNSRSSSGGDRYTGVTVRGNKVLVPVTISFRNETIQARLLLDTGASVTVISPQLASRLGIRPEHTSRTTGRVADGSFITAYNTVVDYMQVGPKTKHSVEVAVLPMNGPTMGFDGLLGMNFLGDFRYHVNMGSQTIEWVQH
ncbi:MAG: retroviral-like aspartic protease family protein [Trichlorobacter sp.]|uniref:retropepsin-like aspartic protease n=1 Tax=Trichlorobacter sp. TaxID=2911007 RepID=UPI00256384BB|nr:retropepsin-like aspartic protease [Trichlorobacter sp.]MDK9717842.1 retroviral-like aspartic protease family protein [Trichlorobacter sp.]